MKLKPFLGLFKNFYLSTSILFVVWMLFFDSNDMLTQYKRKNKLRDLREKKEFYLNNIEEIKKNRKELLSNSQQLEKFAREKYLMKKPNEDVYIIVDKQTTE